MAGYLDRCPGCNRSVNAPLSTVPWGRDVDGVRADYECYRCGRRWFTGWLREAGDVTTGRRDEWDLKAALDDLMRQLRGIS